MTEKEVWKVCRAPGISVAYSPPVPVSAVVGDYRPQLVTRYRIGRWVRPSLEGAKLTAFSSLPKAYTWMRKLSYTRNSFIILRCEAEGVTRARRKFLPCLAIGTLDHVLLYWKRGPAKVFNKIPGLTDRAGWAVPEGTVLCDAIKPLEVVK